MIDKKLELTVEQIKKKLNEVYDREEILKKDIIVKIAELEQIVEDKEMLQTMYMHQKNKEDRISKLFSRGC